MSALTTVPVTIEPEADARVTELGMRREFEQMLDHIRQAVPDLRRIKVTLWEPPFDDDPRVTIDAIHAGEGVPLGTLFDEWCAWVFANISPDVIRHFTFFATLESLHGR